MRGHGPGFFAQLLLVLVLLAAPQIPFIVAYFLKAGRVIVHLCGIIFIIVLMSWTYAAASMAGLGAATGGGGESNAWIWITLAEGTMGMVFWIFLFLQAGKRVKNKS
jgi:hypothetical protein